jgi:hypothetical protein
MRGTIEIRRKWRTTFNFGWVGMFSEGEREKIGGVQSPSNYHKTPYTHYIIGCASYTQRVARANNFFYLVYQITQVPLTLHDINKKHIIKDQKVFLI